MRLYSVLLALALTLSAPATLAREPYVYVKFAKGAAEIALPADAAVDERADGSLLAHLGGTKDHTVEVTIHSIDAPGVPEDAGERFVAEQAEKKGLKLRRGKGRTNFMEPAIDFEKDGQTYRQVHMQVGTGRIVAVITITAPMPMTPVLEAFVGDPLNVLVNSVRGSAT